MLGDAIAKCFRIELGVVIRFETYMFNRYVHRRKKPDFLVISPTQKLIFALRTYCTYENRTPHCSHYDCLQALQIKKRTVIAETRARQLSNDVLVCYAYSSSPSAMPYFKLLPV